MTRPGPTMNHQDSRARAERAFQMHAIGRTWAEVSRELGYKSRGAAQAAVARLHSRQPAESVDSARRSAAESLRITSAVLFDRFAKAAKREDDDTLALLNRELVRNRDQLAKLGGLYQPERVDIDLNVRQTPAEIISDARARLMAVIDAEVIDEPKEIRQ